MSEADLPAAATCTNFVHAEAGIQDVMTEATESVTSRATLSGAARSASARAAAVNDRAMGIEIEAAEIRAVPVIEGCMMEPPAKVAAPMIATESKKESAGIAAATAKILPRPVATKPRMVYVRPVNPKLVTAKPAAPAPSPVSKPAEASTKAVTASIDSASSAPLAAAPVARLMTPPDYAIAPAAILPRFTGEPLRADLQWPPQARGTGEVWPPEAQIEAGETTGRFPLAYAWHMLVAKQPWTWQTEGRTTKVSAAEAITQAISAVSVRQGQPPAKGAMPASDEQGPPVTMVIPNHLDEAAQQELIDAAAAHRINLSLLPRPIAAAMAWCDQHGRELDVDRAESDRPVGSIAVLHFGLDMWEVTTVDIVARRVAGEVRLMPARRRRPIDPLPSYGVELMHRLAIRSLEMSYQQMGPSRVWELVWCTPWLKAALSLLGDGQEPFPSVVALAKHARSAEFLKQQCRQATQRIFRAGEPIAGLLRQCLGKTPQFTDIRDWFAQRKLEAPAEGFLGAVITGPMANVPCDKEAVGLHHLMKIWPKPVRVMIEGVTTPAGLLARSAGWHADFLRRSSQGESGQAATYLDSVPRVRIAATVAGKPTWVDLLEDMPAHVAGGLEVRRPQPLTGFPVKPDTTRFKIAIHHEDLPTVHIAAARLPQVLSQPERVTLHAALRSSHGFPTIELVPVHEGLFGRHRVLVDMRTMKDTGKKPDEFLKSV